MRNECRTMHDDKKKRLEYYKNPNSQLVSSADSLDFSDEVSNDVRTTLKTPTANDSKQSVVVVTTSPVEKSRVGSVNSNEFRSSLVNQTKRT